MYPLRSFFQALVRISTAQQMGERSLQLSFSFFSPLSLLPFSPLLLWSFAVVAYDPTCCRRPSYFEKDDARSTRVKSLIELK